MSDDDKAILELYKLIKMVNERYHICWPKRGENPDLPDNLFFNWNSLHARLNSRYEAWSYKKKKHKKITAYRKSV